MLLQSVPSDGESLLLSDLSDMTYWQELKLAIMLAGVHAKPLHKESREQIS